MANPSPIVTVQDGGGGQQATTNGAVVTAGNVVTVTLSSVASVGVWSLTVVGQDDLVTPPVITVNNVAKTATFTAPALPWSLVLQSQVGINSLGKDVNGQTQPSYTTTLGIYCLTAGGARLFATNERAEGSAAYGWITKINTLIRTPGVPSQNTAAFGTNDAVLSYKEPRFVSTDATPYVTATALYPMPDLTAADVIVRAVGKQAASAIIFVGDYRIRATRNGGAPVLGTLIAGGNQVALGSAAVTIVASGNSIGVNVVGVAATNITWSISMEIHPVTSAT